MADSQGQQRLSYKFYPQEFGAGSRASLTENNYSSLQSTTQARYERGECDSVSYLAIYSHLKSQPSIYFLENKGYRGQPLVPIHNTFTTA